MINPNSSVPMYVQLGNKLSEEIWQGKYAPGDKLPSENELCRQHNVSRITVRQALNMLVQQELAYSVHGKGTYVKPMDMHHELNKIISFSRVLQEKGLKGHTQIRSFVPSCYDSEAVKYLGDDVSNLNLVGYAAQTPIVYYRSYFPYQLGQRMWAAAQEAAQGKSAFSTYELYSRIGIDQLRVEQASGAVDAHTKLAELLKVPDGKALITLKSLYYSADGTPLEYKLGYYNSDIYSFHIQRQI